MKIQKEESMHTGHSQALEELFGIRQCLDSMRQKRRTASIILDSQEYASPADIGTHPELVSEYCR